MIKNLFLNNRFILILILINTAIIFISGFDLNGTLIFFNAIDHIITLLFIVEMVIKIKEYKKEYFKSTWNVLDFSLVVLSIPSLVVFYAHFIEINLSFLLAFRVFRVFRIFKTIRFIKFIPGIEHLLKGIIRALKSSVVALFGFLMYIFITGLLSFYMFRTISPDLFGNPLIALYSTFKVFTVEGWFEIPETIVTNLNNSISFFIYTYFMLILLTGGIIGLSLVNSIFVDAMVSDNNDALEAKIDKLQEKIDTLINQTKK